VYVYFSYLTDNIRCVVLAPRGGPRIDENKMGIGVNGLLDSLPNDVFLIIDNGITVWDGITLLNERAEYKGIGFYDFPFAKKVGIG
jgi:hypothetical protein